MARSPRFALARAVGVTYGLCVLWLAALLFLALPLVQAVARRLSRQPERYDPWWPITRWLLFCASLPKLTAWVGGEPGPRRAMVLVEAPDREAGLEGGSRSGAV
ncbi:MAG: hypothetical protein HUU35_08355 [Armatimonadetes bacterium]|nr:hypothetical protein [Armatimonadota bacterium]